VNSSTLFFFFFSYFLFVSCVYVCVYVVVCALLTVCRIKIYNKPISRLSHCQSRLKYKTVQYSIEFIILPKAHIANTLWVKKHAFTRSAITPQKVNRFG